MAHAQRIDAYAERMTVRELMAALQQLPREANVLAFEPGCEEFCEREVDDVEWQGGRAYLHLGPSLPSLSISRETLALLE